MLPPAKTPRVIGFDDAPFARDDERAYFAGVVCSGTRFEGMVWSDTAKDGWDAADDIARALLKSKYHAQVHAVLLDGIALAGLNMIDLPGLAATVDLPCIAVMRRRPDIEGMARAIRNLPDPERRLAIMASAGTIHERAPFVFQVAGIGPEDAHALLCRVTDRGHVPEALRLAHLIGSAVVDGQSRGRA